MFTIYIQYLLTRVILNLHQSLHNRETITMFFWYVFSWLLRPETKNHRNPSMAGLLTRSSCLKSVHGDAGMPDIGSKSLGEPLREQRIIGVMDGNGIQRQDWFRLIILIWSHEIIWNPSLPQCSPLLYHPLSTGLGGLRSQMCPATRTVNVHDFFL